MAKRSAADVPLGTGMAGEAKKGIMQAKKKRKRRLNDIMAGMQSRRGLSRENER